MTFDEWFAKNEDEVNDEYTNGENIFKFIWNAAIASSLDAVDAVLKQNIDENDVLVYIHEDLKKLLTAS